MSHKVWAGEVNAVIPAVPKWLDWSEHLITFDLSDHPVHVSHPGRYALVMDPLVSGFQLSHVLMDGSSVINIIYAEMLEKMGIPLSWL